jgi:hypothetical protein
MSTFQIVILVVGVLLGISVFVDPKTLISKLRGALTKVKSEVEEVVSEVKEVNVQETTPSVSVVVKDWEALRGRCVDYDLKNSVQLLDKVFPTFIDLVTKETKVNE